MSQTRKMARRIKQQPATSSMVKQAFNSKKSFDAGFAAGSIKQMESDNQVLVDILSRLNEIPGVGLKTAAKIDKWIREQFYKIQ